MEWGIAALYLIYFLISLVFLLMAPFYPAYALSKGASPLSVGVIFALMPGTAFLCSPLMPYVFSAITKKKALAFGCILQSAAMLLLAASADTQGTAFVALGMSSRTTSGFSLALVLSSGMRYAVFVIASARPANETKEIISLLEMFSGAAAMVGPVFSAPLYSVLGFAPVFCISAVVFLACLPLLPLLSAEPSASESDSEAVVGVATMLSLSVRIMQAVSADGLAVVFVVLCGGMMETYVSLHLQSMGVSVSETGALLGLAPAAYTLCCLVFSKKLKDLNMKVTIIVGIAGTVLACVLLGPPAALLPQQWWVVAIAIALMGGSISVAFLPTFPDMLDAAQECGYQVTDSKVANSLGSIAPAAFSLGQMLGPVASGCLLQYMDFVDMTLVLAASGVPILFLYIFLRLRKQRLPGEGSVALDPKSAVT